MSDATEPVRDADGFLYAIGAVLTFRMQLVQPADPYPFRLLVLERVIQQCPGGVQRHYVCRVMGMAPGGVLNYDSRNFLEHELAPWSETPPLSPEDRRRIEHLEFQVDLIQRLMTRQAKSKEPAPDAPA